jgi:FkbM family methyltransferase
MIRDQLIDATIRLHLDEPLQAARTLLSPHGREAAKEQKQLDDLMSRTLRRTSNCIDVGAYRGRVLAGMLRLAPHGRHIAYEPLPHLHRLLARRFPCVDVRNAALSDRPGRASFTAVHDSPGLSGFHNRWAGEGRHRTESIDVRIETLDTDLPPGYAPDFIKVDVEGAERLVFEGGIRTIRTHRPTILFEHGKGGADHYATEPADIHRLLSGEAGLRIFALEGRRPLGLAEFEEEYQRNEQWNFVAQA